MPLKANPLLLAALLAPFAAISLLGSTTAAAATPAGDAAKGEAVFAKCGICHSIKAGETRIGPTLYGVVGRKSGTLPGYAYSAAMKASALTWTPQTLDTYLQAPRAMVPGTKMLFAGLPNADDRANVIAYLVKSGPAK